MRVIVVCILFFVVSFAGAETLYSFNSPAQKKQFDYLTQHLRCLVCQNESIADSTAGLAADLRADVYQRVLAGNSDAQILEAMRAHYGDFILFSPPIDKRTYFLWFGPFVLCVGILIGLIIFVKRRYQP